MRPGPILGLLLIANLAIGVSISKSTSVVRARVVGVPSFDRERIEGILAKLHDTPCLRIDPRAVECEVQSLSDVESAEFSRNLFGNALLTVRYRTPVARINESAAVALSSDGVVYSPSEMPPDLPSLDVPSNGPPTLMTFAGNWQPINLAKLAIYARHSYARSVLKIDVDARGVVCLNIGSGRVILGSCDDMDLKLKTLETRLQKNPQELEQEQALNLTWPATPAVVQKDARTHSQPIRIKDQ